MKQLLLAAALLALAACTPPRPGPVVPRPPAPETCVTDSAPGEPFPTVPDGSPCPSMTR